MRYSLDTNIVSDLVRHPRGRVAAKIDEIGEDKIGVSIIVASELRYGAEKKGSARLNAQLESVLDLLTILPFEPPADALYGKIRTQLERSGSPIGGNDLFIAAQAISLGLIVVTANEAEFTRVAGLNCENWLR
jgi:tRNA(fMet)-specific endonuclease VapC